MQRREVTEGHAGVDVVGEVVANAIRNEEELGETRLLDVMSGVSAIVGTGHPTVFGDRPEPILDLIPGEVGQ